MVELLGAASMAVECAHGGYGTGLLSLIVQWSGSWHAWMCLSHPCRLARRVHEDSLCEATSELTVSDSVVGLTSDLHLPVRSRRGCNAISGLEGRQRSARSALLVFRLRP